MKKIILMSYAFIYLFIATVASAEVKTPVNEGIATKKNMTFDRKVDDIFDNKVGGFIEQSVELDTIRKKIILTNEKIKLLRVEQQLEKIQREMLQVNKVENKPAKTRNTRPAARTRAAKSTPRKSIINSSTVINNGQFDVLSVSNFNGELLIVLNWNGVSYKLKKGRNSINSYNIFVGNKNITVSNNSASRTINYKII